MDVPGHSGYFGHVVMGGVISLVPYFAEIDTSTIEGRLLLAGAGAMGAAIAIIGDRPKSINDGLCRIVVGVFSCFLFAPYIARKVGLDSDLNGNLMVFGALGVCSWYFTGSLTRLLITLRDNGSMGRAFLAAFRGQMPAAPDVPTTKKTPIKPTPVKEDKCEAPSVTRIIPPSGTE